MAKKGNLKAKGLEKGPASENANLGNSVHTLVGAGLATDALAELDSGLSTPPPSDISTNNSQEEDYESASVTTGTADPAQTDPTTDPIDSIGQTPESLSPESGAFEETTVEEVRDLGNGKDSYSGSDSGELIDGGNGRDSLSALAGDDIIVGGNAKDSINAGDGDDYIDGGRGKDYIDASSGNDIVYGGQGADILIGGAGDDLLYGGQGNDLVDGGSGDDVIEGGDGRDTLLGGSGNDILDGGDGDDILNGGGSGSSNSDDYYGTEADDDMFGTDRDERFWGLGGDDLIDTGAGNDIAYGGTGSDSIKGMDGDDSLYGEAGNDTLDGGDGDDLLVGGTGNDRMVGSWGSDTYLIQAANLTESDSIYDFPGFSGTDTLKFEGIDESEITGVTRDGYDLIFDFASGGTLKITSMWHSNYDQAAIEKLEIGGVTYDVPTFFVGTTESLHEFLSFTPGAPVSGTEADDDLFGSSQSEQISGLGGDDLIDTGAGNDTADGGAGADTIKGMAGDDELRGAEGNDSLDGGDGDDLLIGGTGNDHMVGSWGSDTYLIQAENLTDSDTIYDFPGFTGTDTLKFEGIDESEISAVTRDGYDLIFDFASGGTLKITSMWNSNYDQAAIENLEIGGNTYDIPSFFIGAASSLQEFLDFTPEETVSGTELADDLFGSSLGEEINGLGGDDLIDTGSGDDTAAGGTGADTIKGMDGNDNLFGNEGNDSLDGGDGDDLLVGGTGNDRMVGSWGSDTYLIQAEDLTDSDTIYDFPGFSGVDTLKFDGIAESEITGVTRDGYDLLIDFASGGTLKISSMWHSNYDQAALEKIEIDGNTYDVPDYFIGSVDNLMDFINFTPVFGTDGNDTLTGGGGKDTFIFEQGSGSDVITDFQISTTNSPDKIDLSDYRLAGFDSLTIATNVDGDAVITLTESDEITLQGISADELSADDFNF